MRLCAALAVSLSFGAAAEVPPGDSQRGALLFQREGCVTCHSIAGQGGKTAPDLGRLVDRNFTPVLLAATMWNHAPAMFAALRKQGVVKSTLSPESAADLFAYFYATRFFDRPGEAGRGKALFASRRCAECHGITSSNFAGAKPVAEWRSIGHPVALVHDMWNHAGQMKDALAKKGIAWPQLTSQELSDILVYVRNLPQTRGKTPEFRYETAAGGEAVFEAKGCAKCHAANSGLQSRIRGATLTGIAASMWNHAPRMASTTPALTEEEMRKVLSYLWARQFFEAGGDAGRGKRVFASKGCAGCHSGGGAAPDLAARKGTYSGVTMVSALWEHGPRMMERMREQKVAWPRLEAGQMADLIAYLNAGR